MCTNYLTHTESYAHRDEVVKAKRTDKKAFEGYVTFALTCLVSQVILCVMCIILQCIIQRCFLRSESYDNEGI